jgi:hypothetical protein
MQVGDVHMFEGLARIGVPGLRQDQYLTLLGLEKAISSHRNIPDLFRDLRVGSRIFSSFTTSP